MNNGCACGHPFSAHGLNVGARKMPCFDCRCSDYRRAQHRAEANPKPCRCGHVANGHAAGVMTPCFFCDCREYEALTFDGAERRASRFDGVAGIGREWAQTFTPYWPPGIEWPGYAAYDRPVEHTFSFTPAIMPEWLKAALDAPPKAIAGLFPPERPRGFDERGRFFIGKESTPGRPVEAPPKLMESIKVRAYDFNPAPFITGMTLTLGRETSGISVEFSCKIKRGPIAVAEDIRATHREIGDLELERAKARAAYLEAERRIEAAQDRLEALQTELDEAEAE